jgi:hypothetical protein
MVRCGAVIAVMLLATVTSAYADHAAAGKGTYDVLSPVILAEFHFVVANRVPNLHLEPGLNVVQSEITGRDGAKPFQTSLISTALAPFEITTEAAGRTVTITGQMVSTTFLGVGEGRQHFAELVSFEAIGVDARATKPGADHFTLKVTYSEPGQGELFARLGFGDCVDGTCVITFEGQVKRGDIFVHTSGDE